MELISIITAFTVFTSYLILVLVKLGVQKSISYSDVIQKKPFQMCFELTMWICGACLVWYSTTNNIPLAIIGGACIFMVGNFTRITRAKWVYWLHMFFAISGFVLSFIGVYYSLYQLTINNGYSLDSYIMLCLGVLVALLGSITFSEKRLFAFEVALSYVIFIGMILNLIIK